MGQFNSWGYLRGSIKITDILTGLYVKFEIDIYKSISKGEKYAYNLTIEEKICISPLFFVPLQ